MTASTCDSGHSGSSLLRRFRGFFSPRSTTSSVDCTKRPQRQQVDAHERRLTHPSASLPSRDGVDDRVGDGITSSPVGRSSGEHFESVFQYLDQNGDGKISPSELRSYMKAVGEDLSPEDAEAVVESSDSDGDGLLGFDDFVKLVDVGEEERIRDLAEAFGMYEMKGEGGITPKSLRRALHRLGETKTIEECKVMIQRFDVNGDGVLSFDEFKIMML